MIFAHPDCRISNLVEKGIAEREAASRYLQEPATIGVLHEPDPGKDKLFIDPELMRLLSNDGNAMPACVAGPENP